MNLCLTEDQKDLQKLVADFVKKEIAPNAAFYDREGKFPWDLYNQAVEIGLHSITIPEEYGGMAFDTLTNVIVSEELARGCAGFADIMAGNGLASYPVLLAGREDQKKLFFDIVMQGKPAAFCLTEPNAGSDVAAVSTTARRDGDEYILNGSKVFITNGSVASVYTVFATVDKSKGIKGLTAFLVERDRPGVSTGKKEDKMGIRCADTAEVVFQDVRIPASNMLGKEGEGFKIAMQTIDIGRPVIAAIAVGLAQSALDYSIKYSKERLQFGKTISSFQAIQFMLADMAIEIEAARWLTYRAAYMMDAGLPFTKEAAMAKTFSSDVAMKVTTDAVQILGGYGYIKEYPVEKLMRDAKIFQIFEGTNQIQRVVIAGQLLK